MSDNTKLFAEFEEFLQTQKSRGRPKGAKNKVQHIKPPKVARTRGRPKKQAEKLVVLGHQHTASKLENVVIELPIGAGKFNYSNK